MPLPSLPTLLGANAVLLAGCTGILSRGVKLAKGEVSEAVERAEALAFPVEELIEVEQGEACDPWREEAR
jgi:hypothetical protein